MSAAKNVGPWRVLSSRTLHADRWLRLRADRCETPDGVVVEPYHVIECADGVNVVALTGAGRLLLTREYRHGNGETMLGVVGGFIDPADASPEAAARRELREETGYGGGRFTPVLTCWQNPARQTNRVTTFLALAVERVAAPSLDPAEAVEVVEDDLAEVLARLLRGAIRLSATHAAALWSAAHALLAEGRAPGDLHARLRRLFSPST